MMETTRASVLGLVVLISLCLFGAAPPTTEAVTIVTMSSGPMELTLIPHSMSGQDCSMSICPADKVTNFFFNDVIPNDDPCYLADVMRGRSEGHYLPPSPPSSSSSSSIST
jgi:hypothetical protein